MLDNDNIKRRRVIKFKDSCRYGGLQQVGARGNFLFCQSRRTASNAQRRGAVNCQFIRKSSAYPSTAQRFAANRFDFSVLRELTPQELREILDRDYQHREVKMEMLRRFRGPVAFATCLVICSSAEIAADTKPAINLDIAKKMIAACEAKAKQEGWKMNIAIVDDGANLVAFERMDGAYLGSIQVAQYKATTSAKFPFSTRRFGELAFGKEGKPGMVPGIANFPGIVTFAGGLPIMTANNVQVGGIGVSGGTSDQDEQCAQAGIDAVKSELT